MKKKLIVTALSFSMVIGSFSSVFAADIHKSSSGKSLTGEAKTENLFSKANVEDYSIKLNVDVNQEGKITAISDNGTSPNDPYSKNLWKKYLDWSEKGYGLSAFYGKTYDEIVSLKLDEKTNKLDSSTGATISAIASKKAILDAMKDYKSKSNKSDTTQDEASRPSGNDTTVNATNIYQGEAVGLLSLGDSGSHLPYPLRVKVSVDSNGKILLVEDNGSDPTSYPEDGSSDRDGIYMGIYKREGGFKKFNNKTLEDVERMQMMKTSYYTGTPGNAGADGITGATASSLAAKQAVINALKNKKEWVPSKKNPLLKYESNTQYGRGGKEGEEKERTFNAIVKVTLDNSKSKILKVEDFNTNPKEDPDADFKEANAFYWTQYKITKGFNEFTGKTLDDVRRMYEKNRTGKLEGVSLISHMVTAAVMNSFNLYPMYFETPKESLKLNSIHGPWKGGVAASAHDYYGSFRADLLNYLPMDYDVEITKVRYGIIDDKTKETSAKFINKGETVNGISHILLDIKGEKKPGYYALEVHDKNNKYKDMVFSLKNETPNYSTPGFTVEDKKNVIFKNGVATCDTMSLDEINRQIKEIEIYDESGKKLLHTLPMIDGNTNPNYKYINTIYKDHPLLTKEGKINPELRDEKGNKVLKDNTTYMIHFHTWNGGGGEDSKPARGLEEFVRYNSSDKFSTDKEDPTTLSPDILGKEHSFRVGETSYTYYHDNYYGYVTLYYPDVVAFSDKSGYKINLKSTLPKAYDLKLVKVTYGMDAEKGEKVDAFLIPDKKSIILPGKVKPGNYFVHIEDGKGKYKTVPVQNAPTRVEGVRNEYNPLAFFTIPFPYIQEAQNVVFNKEKLALEVNNNHLSVADLYKNIYEAKIKEKGSKEQTIKVIDNKTTQYVESWINNPLLDSQSRLNLNYKLDGNKSFEAGKEYSVTLKIAADPNFASYDQYRAKPLDSVSFNFTMPSDEQIAKLKDVRAKDDATRKVLEDAKAKAIDEINKMEHIDKDNIYYSVEEVQGATSVDGVKKALDKAKNLEKTAATAAEKKKAEEQATADKKKTELNAAKYKAIDEIKRLKNLDESQVYYATANIKNATDKAVVTKELENAKKLNEDAKAVPLHLKDLETVNKDNNVKVKDFSVFFQIGESKGLALKFDGDFAKFEKGKGTVKANGKTLKADRDYKVIKGSIIIDFAKDYLKTLTPGKYNVEVEQEGGRKGLAKLVILKSKEEPKSDPKEEPKSDPKEEPKPDSKPTPKADPKQAPNADLKADLKPTQKPNPMDESKQQDKLNTIEKNSQNLGNEPKPTTKINQPEKKKIAKTSDNKDIFTYVAIAVLAMTALVIARRKLRKNN
ncbi:hypothetical protein ACGCUQ_00225 [Eubacteriales bacterium KG127]